MSTKMEESTKQVITFVLLGKPGSGKSRTGNTITGMDKAFLFGWHASSISHRCESMSIEILEQSVCVIDTPGVSKFEKPEYEKIKDVIPGVGAHKIIFLLCMSVGRFTREERLLIDQYFNVFGEDFVENTIIIFTHLDEWESDMQDRDVKNFTFDAYLKSLPEETKRIIKRFNDRYLTVNNKQEKKEKNLWRIRLMDMTGSMEGYTMRYDISTSRDMVWYQSITTMVNRWWHNFQRIIFGNN